MVRAAALFVAVFGMAACSETDDDEEEFPDWKNTNDEYFENLYDETVEYIEAGGTDWKIIPSWALEENVVDDSYDNIIVEVINEGTGSGCPLYSDTVKVHYEGRLLPSVSYPEGYVFDQSFYGEYDTTTAMPSTFAVTALVDGFATAVQNMHIGDRWKVYTPYQLGYGVSGSGTIPTYSVLIFDITLVSYYHVGEEVPDSKAKTSGEWIVE